MAPRLHVRNFQKDVVYLFQYAGNATVSSLSPFCTKVEAFCRLHNLKLERILLPFIELNGQHTADSQFILNKLTYHFKLPTYDNAHSAGVGHAIEMMIENHTLHLLRYDMGRTLYQLSARWLADQGVPSIFIPLVAWIGAWDLRRKLHRIAATAIGKFTEAEYDEMLRNDLIQLQNVLGEKQFLIGDEPTRVDCIALAHIGVAYYSMPNERSRVHEFIDSEELSGFKQYLNRVVKRFYDDQFNDKQ